MPEIITARTRQADRESPANTQPQQVPADLPSFEPSKAALVRTSDGTRNNIRYLLTELDTTKGTQRMRVLERLARCLNLPKVMRAYQNPSNLRKLKQSIRKELTTLGYEAKNLPPYLNS